MEPNTVAAGAPASTTQSPPPPASPPPVSNPSAGTGGVGVTPAAGVTPQPVPTQTPVVQSGQPQIAPEIQAQLDRYRAMEGEYNQLSQFKHLIPLGYRAYQQAGQPNPNQPAAQPAAAAHPWGLPQFDKRLLDFVGKDPATGQLALLPGAPPDALLRVQEFQAKFREAHENLLTDPAKALGPIFEKMFADRFQKQFGEQFGAIQQQQQTQRIIADNAKWLYAVDAQGNQVTQFDPASGSNKPVLSGYGQQYVQLVKQAVQYGIQDTEAQHNFAVQGLTNLVYQQRFSQTQQVQQGQQTAQNFTQQAAQTAVQQLNNNNPNAIPAEIPPTDLRAKMRAAMEGNGITDTVMSQQLNRVA